MIQLKDVSKTFNKGSAMEVVALNRLTLTINTGEFVVVTGSNGSGKSTLLNCIAGTVLPDEGEILINNSNVESLPEHKRSRYVSRIFQNPMQGTAADLSIRDNFRLAALRSKSKQLVIGTTKQFDELVREKISTLKMGIEKNISRPVASLSGGQRQALTLLMAVMDECSVLLLDEPTSALDPRSAVVIMEKANEIILTNKLTAIFITHHLKDALKYGNRIISMNEGKIQYDFSEEKKRNLTLEEIAGWYD